jgi:hypothetical protein
VRLLHRNPTFCPDHVGLRDATANPTYGYLLNNGIANYAIIKQIACNTQGEVKSIVPASPTATKCVPDHAIPLRLLVVPELRTVHCVPLDVK